MEFPKDKFPIGTIIEFRDFNTITTNVIIGYHEINEITGLPETLGGSIVMKETDIIFLKQYDKDFMDNYELNKRVTLLYREILRGDYDIEWVKDRYIFRAY